LWFDSLLVISISPSHSLTNFSYRKLLLEKRKWPEAFAFSEEPYQKIKGKAEPAIVELPSKGNIFQMSLF
jgi:hypothetical protein